MSLRQRRAGRGGIVAPAAPGGSWSGCVGRRGATGGCGVASRGVMTVIEVAAGHRRRGRHAWSDAYVADVMSATAVGPAGVRLYRQLARAVERDLGIVTVGSLARSVCVDQDELGRLFRRADQAGLVRIGPPGRPDAAVRAEVAMSVPDLTPTQMAGLPALVRRLGSGGPPPDTGPSPGPLLHLAPRDRGLRFAWSDAYVLDVIGGGLVLPRDVTVYRHLARAAADGLDAVAAGEVAAAAGMRPAGLDRSLGRLSEAGLVALHRPDGRTVEVAVSMTVPVALPAAVAALSELVQVTHAGLIAPTRPAPRPRTEARPTCGRRL